MENKEILVNGQVFAVHYLYSDTKNAIACVRSGVITIKLPRRWPHGAMAKIAENLEKRMIRRLLNPKPRMSPLPAAMTEDQKKWIILGALPRIAARVNELNSQYFGSCLGKIRIRSNLTNWGSCSPKNNISINFALLFLPQQLLDYVIIHELGHTKMRNHSERFWRIIESIIPDYRIRKKELGKYTLAN